MKAMIKKKNISLLTAIIVLATANYAACESLFEYYTNATTETLSAETSDMGKVLRTVFSQGSVTTQQQKIDFAEYFSNLKKTTLFATRLAVYSEYETDLRFARDNEVFKGLPEDNPSRDNGPPIDRKDFVQSKYDRMKINIAEEIETYNDLILLSLDTCEMLTANDLSDISENADLRDKVNQFLQGKEYRAYKTRQVSFRERWPELENRISTQFATWRPKPPSPDDPIIDPNIVGTI